MLMTTMLVLLLWVISPLASIKMLVTSVLFIFSILALALSQSVLSILLIIEFFGILMLFQMMMTMKMMSSGAFVLTSMLVFIVSSATLGLVVLIKLARQFNQELSIA